MPNAPINPSKTPHPRADGGGSDSPDSTAIAREASNPQVCATATKRNTLARLVANPPEKSPPPQGRAASRVRPEACIVATFIAGYNIWLGEESCGCAHGQYATAQVSDGL